MRKPDTPTFAHSSAMQVRLDPASKRILVAFLASPKTPIEVSRVYGIPVATVRERIRRLQELGLVHMVLTFVDSTGQMREYYEAAWPIGSSAGELGLEWWGCLRG